MKTEREGYWLTVAEAALQLQVDSSRVRQILLKDQERSETTRRFPSGRKATEEEEKALFLCRRIGLIPVEGVWLIDARDVTNQAAQRGLFLGRPPKARTYYADCPWYFGLASPATEAFDWACDGDHSCTTAILSAAAEHYYERCLPTAAWVDGGWEVVEPKRHAELLRDAFQQHECGKIAGLMITFHAQDPLEMVKIVVQAERHFWAEEAQENRGQSLGTRAVIAR
jgi:hypothetical protein